MSAERLLAPHQQEDGLKKDPEISIQSPENEIKN
jgi:hypothetical protein